MSEDFDLDGLDLDAAEAAVAESTAVADNQPAPIADNDCGGACAI